MSDSSSSRRPGHAARSAGRMIRNVRRFSRKVAAITGEDAGFLSIKLHDGKVTAPHWGRARPALLSGPRRRHRTVRHPTVRPCHGAALRPRPSDAEIAKRFGSFMARLLRPYEIRFGALAVEIAGGEMYALALLMTFRDTPADVASFKRVLPSLVA